MLFRVMYKYSIVYFYTLNRVNKITSSPAMQSIAGEDQGGGKKANLMGKSE